MSGAHAKPITTFNLKKIVLALMLIVLIGLAAIGAWQMYYVETEDLPSGISSIGVTAKLADVTAAAANKQSAKQVAGQDVKAIESAMSEYLNNAFIDGTVKNPIVPDFIKKHKNKLIPLKGKANLDDLNVIYDENNKAILAITQIDLSAKYFLPKDDKKTDKETTNRQFEYSVKGELILKKEGTWKITNMNLDSNTKKYKAVEN